MGSLELSTREHLREQDAVPEFGGGTIGESFLSACGSGHDERREEGLNMNTT